MILDVDDVLAIHKLLSLQTAAAECLSRIMAGSDVKRLFRRI